jgi:acetoacetyl-CoA synthetase
MTTPRWKPSPERRAEAALTAFTRDTAARIGRPLPDYDALHAWSVEDVGRFWSAYVRWSGIAFDRLEDHVLSSDPMHAVRWFEGSRLNYARALLRHGLPDASDEAVVAVDETGERRALGWEALEREVARAQGALRREGVVAGDRVAAVASNSLEALVLMLGCAGLGAVFTSCSPDFGFEAAHARLAQVSPTVLAVSPAYRYAGKRFEVVDTGRRLAAATESVTRLVWLPVPGEPPFSGANGMESAWEEWLPERGAHEAHFEPLPFDHPLWVLYSSGTTGTPKAIVHRAGGALLTHHKEHRLHVDVRPGDRVLYVSTLGWMMWNWLVSALAQGATVVLYDGAPTWPDGLALWRLLARERVTLFGTGARYLNAMDASGVRPSAAVDLGALRTLASTGSPLAPSGFRFVYEHVKRDVHLASISGGTDIVGCFMLGVPTLPVYDGQIQRPGLGVDLAVFDDAGNELSSGPGELVCRAPLPSMPLGFWGDADGARYRAAYFARYPGVWWHGDLVERTAEGGVVVHGRSDATLNPGGVRIGTAEIYRPLERFGEVREACAVGRRTGDDEEIWLLVVLAEGVELDEALVERIRSAIRHEASPRHVPRRVVRVRDLPRTRSGKPMELAVRAIVNGGVVANREVMDDPGVCDEIARAVRDAA